MALTLPVQITAGSACRRFVGSYQAPNCACFKLMLFLSKCKEKVRVPREVFSFHTPLPEGAVHRPKEQERECCSIEQTHSAILAHPRFAGRRDVLLESRNVLRDYPGEALLVRAPVALECVSHLIARVCKSGNGAIFRKSSDRGVELADPLRPSRTLLGGILDDEHIWSVSIDDLGDMQKASVALSRPARLACSPIERCLSGLRAG